MVTNLKHISSLNSQAKQLIQALEILLDLSSKEPPSNSYGILTTFLKSTKNIFCLDIAYVALIKLDLFNGRIEDAISRYNFIESKGIYTLEAFYEFLADNDTLISSYNTNRLCFTELEFTDLIRGLFRVEAYEFAYKVSRELEEKFPSQNSRVLTLYGKWLLLQVELEGMQYWYINFDLWESTNQLCGEVISLVDETKGDDRRLLEIASWFYDYIDNNKELDRVCLDHIKKLEDFNPNLVDFIRFEIGYEIKDSNNLLYKINKANKNIVYKNELLESLEELNSFSSEDYYLYINLASPNEVKKWLEKGGAVIIENDFEKSFIELELYVLSSESYQDKIGRKLEVFIEQYRDKVQFIIAKRLFKFIVALAKLNLNKYIITIVKLVLAKEGMLWLSPIVNPYLVALLNSDQWQELEEVLGRIDEKIKDPYVWTIHANISYRFYHNIVDAICYVEKAIEKNRSSLDNWVFLLRLYKEKNSTNLELQQILDKVPDNSLKIPSDAGYRILADMLRSGREEKALFYLVEWFIQDPDKYAIPTVDNYIARLFSSNKDINIISFCYKTTNCFGGVKYTLDGELNEKLLVSPSIPKHAYLLDIESPLGKLLSTMGIGNEDHLGIKKIKLINRKPAGLAVFHVATKLRSESNDGSDTFDIFTTPPELDSFKEKLILLGNQKKSRDFLNTPNIPIFMLGKFENQYDSVKASLNVLNDDRIKLSFLNNLGNPPAMLGRQ